MEAVEAAAQLPEYDEATQNLVNAAMATAAARAAGGGYGEAVTALVRAAVALPGCRFKPRDDELIRLFLEKKAKGEPVPFAGHMRDANVRHHSPMALAAALPKLGDCEFYFFTPRDRKYRKGYRPDRATDGGYWKATGVDKPVVSEEGKTVGFKRSLVFYLGGGKDKVKTNWIMHEYRLNQDSIDHALGMRLDNWVLCSIHNHPPRVTLKRRREDVDVDEDVNPDDNIANLEQQQPLINSNNNNTSFSSSAEAEAVQDHSHQQDHHLPTTHGAVNFNNIPVFEQYAQQPSNVEASAGAGVEQYYMHQQDHQYAYLPTTLGAVNFNNIPVFEQYAQQPSASQYLTQCVDSNASAGAGVEQYYMHQQDHHLPTTLGAANYNNIPVFEQYAQQPSRVEGDQQYLMQCLEQNLSINNNACAIAEAEQFYSYQQYHLQPTLHVPDNSFPISSLESLDVSNNNILDPVLEQDKYAQQLLINNNTSISAEAEQCLGPQQGVGSDQGAGCSFEWVKDFFDFDFDMPDYCMGCKPVNEGQGSSSITSAAAYNQASLQQHQQQHQGF